MEKNRSVKFDKPVNFSNGVLVGSWVEDRSSYKKNNFKHRTIYSDEFVQKPFDTDNSNLVWNQKIQAEGNGFIPPQRNNESCSYFDNFSSLYDLSYKYFPNWFGSPIFRNIRFRLGTYEPMDEYLHSYGNMSNYGLSNYKRHEWQCDLQDPRTATTTSYEDSFLSPKKSDYTFCHWCRKTPKIENHPSLPKCDIITWKCKNK